MSAFLSATTLVAAIGFLALAFHRGRQQLCLHQFEIRQESELPGLSIVIAAKDEEETIHEALDSLLSLDYPDLEIVLVNDRSEDRTLVLAQSLGRDHPQGKRLKIVDCQSLPRDWLGKVHALHLGVQKARHPLILLTDADVIFESSSLRRAASAQQALDCDHLVVAPKMITRGFWEPVLVSFFLILFAFRFQPTEVHKKKKRYIGVGAFNLLNREALERCEYLEPLRLQVIDDVHLGRLVKSRGLAQRCLVAREEIKVRWFQGLSGCILGMEKNAYAGLEYSLLFSAVGIGFVLSPTLTVLALGLLGQWLLLGLYLGFLLCLGLCIPRSCELPAWIGLTFPLASAVLAYTFFRSVWLAERQGGVRWRGTHYDLRKLRAAHHRFKREIAPL